MRGMAVGACPPTGKAPDGGVLLRRAWLAIALIPVFLVLGFAVGEATLAALGHPSGGDVPLWAALIADLTATAVCVLPGVMAVLWGRRAAQAGARRTALPVAIGAAATLALVLLTVVTEIGNAI